MYAETIDTGATVSVLRAFGPPDIVELADFAGNAQEYVGADGFWTVIRAVAFGFSAGNGAIDRYPSLEWLGMDGERFAAAVVSTPIGANVGATVSFAIGVLPAGSVAAGTIVAPIPELVLLPGYKLRVTCLNGQGVDSFSVPRVTLQRYQLIDCDDLIAG